MIGQKFNIAEYDWKVKVYYNITKYDIDFCFKQLSKLTTKSYVFRECKRTLYTDEKDKGFTYSSFVKHESVIFIGVPSSTGELIDTITHEANHLKSHIATAYNLNEKDEEVCYIIGNIAKRMSNIFIHLICNECLII